MCPHGAQCLRQQWGWSPAGRWVCGGAGPWARAQWLFARRFCAGSEVLLLPHGPKPVLSPPHLSAGDLSLKELPPQVNRSCSLLPVSATNNSDTGLRLDYLYKHTYLCVINTCCLWTHALLKHECVCLHTDVFIYIYIKGNCHSLHSMF